LDRYVSEASELVEQFAAHEVHRFSVRARMAFWLHRITR